MVLRLSNIVVRRIYLQELVTSTADLKSHTDTIS